MKLLRIRLIVWDVLAIVNHRNQCMVLDDLRAMDRSIPAVQAMNALLKDYVPTHGPPLDNRNYCSPLGDGIFQLKRGPKKGKKLRVPFFYRPGKRVVCTEAALKTDKLPRAVINRAHALRNDYLTDEANNAIEIVEDM